MAHVHVAVRVARNLPRKAMAVDADRAGAFAALAGAFADFAVAALPAMAFDEARHAMLGRRWLIGG